MIQTGVGVDKRVQVQQLIDNQLPEFILSESPKAVDFLKQYYISQEYQGGPLDLADNLDQYLKLDNLTPEVITGSTTLSADITSSDDVVQVASTKGFPNQYGLFKIDDEIFTYTGSTTTSFTGCIRGFSGVTNYRSKLNPDELVFEETNQAAHTSGATVTNLSSLFLKEFYKKLKYSLTPGLEDVEFASDVDVNNFIKQARDFYQAKGTEESFRILFNVLYGVNPKVTDLESYLLKPSTAKYLKREIVVAEAISGEAKNLIGQTIRKSSDSATQAPVSEVEVFARPGVGTFYRLYLFVGYDDNDLIEGNFTIQPKTRVIQTVPVGSSTITVDSTIGFANSGTLISGNNTITYTDKTINQFLGCSGITEEIASKSDIRNDEYYYGYENGDTTKEVRIRLTGVLSKYESIIDNSLTTEGEKIYVKNVGERILNPENDKSYKQIFANSWVYNTSTRFDIESISGSNFIVKTDIDKSQLSVGDKVNILNGSTENIVHSNATVSLIDNANRQVVLSDLTGFTVDPNQTYSFRRNLKTASSSGTPIAQGNNVITSDIQNVYNEDNEYMYVTSNSLPSYEIDNNVKKSTLTSAVNGTSLLGYNQSTEKYSIISFPSSVPFLTGDEVYYSAETDVLDGLEEKTYFVKVLSPNNRISLHDARSLIDAGIAVEFKSTNTSGSHSLTLNYQKEEEIYPQKLLKKFPLQHNIKDGTSINTEVGSVGMLINGVEVLNYKSLDKIYYGPVKEVKVYNKGKDYDVISAPSVIVDDPIVSSGTTALVQPVINGSVKEILVDPQDFDIQNIPSVSISGGNGSGAVLQPILEKRNREVFFSPKPTTQGGGVNVINNTITFQSQHYFIDGMAVVYDNKSDNTVAGISSISNVGIATVLGSGNNNIQDTTLSQNSLYYVKVIGANVGLNTVQLYTSQTDALSGINTVGLTTQYGNGVQAFRVYEPKNTLKAVKVINPGSDYRNRKLIAKPSNISISDYSIVFENHGFGDGDIVNYSVSTGGVIAGGLSTTTSYYVLKEDNNRFRLANSLNNYTRKNFVGITSVGSGDQIFSYPDITVSVSVNYGDITGIGTDNVGVITATPVVRGEIIDAYLYEEGTGYGSSTLNFHNPPNITVRSSTRDAEFKVITSQGKITKVQVTYGGTGYTSAPDLVINGKGIGARLRAIVNASGVLTAVVILNPGAGYDDTTTIYPRPVGSSATIYASVRDLNVNRHSRYSDDSVLKNLNGSTGLQYAAIGYYNQLQDGVFETLDTDNITHSPIIGWAYDGNPIYGPYSYTDSDDTGSTVIPLQSGYTLNTSNVTDRPSGFSAGFFVEDYTFDNSGNLDEYNGRFGRTPEFPNGVYAYFASIDTNSTKSEFPYFIGNSYKSIPLEQNLDQGFDFNSTTLVRNTFPYNVFDEGADNDFLLEPYEVIPQSATIESISKGYVQGFVINEPGDFYKVGDVAVFDSTGTDGSGLAAEVGSIKGKNINYITTTVDTFTNSSVVWKNSSNLLVQTTSNHSFSDGDTVVISGVSTFIGGLTNSHVIGVTSESTYLLDQLAINATAGVVTDIYVTTNPSFVSVGSTLGIGTERVRALNVFPENKVIRIERGITGTAHTDGAEVFTVPDTFTIPLSVDYFEPPLDSIKFFNPEQSIGIGTTAGIDVSNDYEIGQFTQSISVPTQSIYIPNHPFKTNQEVILTRPSGANAISVATTSGAAAFTIPQSGDTETLFVINKSKDFIGLTTQVGLTTNTNGLFFTAFTANADDNDYKYSLETNLSQVTARVERVTATIGVTTSHELTAGDSITLDVKPNQSVGIGTSTAVRVKYNSNKDKLLINPIGFTSDGVNSATNVLTLTNHGLKTGEKVFYEYTDNNITGLDTGSYYVYRIDDNQINLTQTYYDALLEPPTVVSFASTGGANQELSLINPQLKPIKNNNLVFDVSDSSLSGYNFKIFTDKDFNNEFISVGSGTTFGIIGVGTVGVSTNATVTLNYDAGLPLQLYYNIENSGFISTSDKGVKNGSEIVFVDSLYNGNFKVSSSGLAVTTFQANLKALPEVLTHNQNTTSTLEYSTTSASAKGGVKTMKINYGGQNYKKLPEFVSITSTEGVSADIIPTSTNIGKIKSVKINNPGFDYSADKTLSPEVFISPNITIINRSTVSSVEVVSGGSNYTTPPNLVLVNPETGEKYDNGVLEANLQGTSIQSVDVVAAPSGLSENLSKVYAVDNSNGINVNQVAYTQATGIVTFTLATPIAGLSSSLFSVGEKIYVEGVGLYSTTGEGFNSEDHNYTLFTVTQYAAGPANNPATLQINISGVTTNPGVAKTNQSGYTILIKESDYPVFKVSQTNKDFNDGEKLSTVEGTTIVPRNLVITESLNNQIKVYGSYELKENDVIVGDNTGTRATIKTIEETKSFFRIDYSLKKDVGWSDDIGKLNLDYQVIPDNDYYQNLSYTVKSPITYEQLVNPVNRLLHTTGLKNFADVGITSTVGFATTSIQQSTTFALIDLISDNRVDTINNYDYGLDIDVENNKSKFVKVQNRKLTDYIKCISNRVLSIDNISNQFSSGNIISNFYVDVDNYNIDDGYSRFLVQITDPDNNEKQSTEIITLPSVSDDIVTVEKASLYNTDSSLGDVSGNISDSGNLSLRFTPTEQYTKDYDIKVLKNNFNSELAGIGTQSLGLINLISRINTSVGIGSTATIIGVSTNTNNALFVISEVINPTSKERTYVEMYIDHDGVDTNISDYFFDNNQSVELSSNFIGTFASDISSNTLSLNFTNNTESNVVNVRSRIVGFGTTAAGISTYTFTTTGQTADQADTVQLQSNFVEATGISTVVSLGSTTNFTTIKTLARVSYGSTSALHQLLVVNDGTDVYTSQYSYLSANSATGIGTFAGAIVGTNLDLRFYPDAGITTDVLIQSYSEIIKSEIDLVNDPDTLSYGPITEDVLVAQYNAPNGNRVNVTEFEMLHDETPIFMKTFNPSTASVLNPVTGVFTIKDHFFSTGEELIYRPGDTFGNTATAVSIGETSSGSVGIGTTTILPSTVYAIKINNDQFKIATVASFATTSILGADSTPGIGVTFTDVSGKGNAHELEMVKKMEKSIISIDGVVQSPIAYTAINHSLTFGINSTETIFALSGISSITPGNILRIEDEYLNVTSVGFGTTSSGPITGIGTTALIEVERGFVGSSATTHAGLTTARVYIGSFNIVKNKIQFTEAPLGDPLDILNSSELESPESTFNGRVYLRQDYSSNQIYDNISDSFTGIGQTYTLSVGGTNTIGIETGSGVLFINDIFQTPTTDNNEGNNYEFSESAGISSVVFSGITTAGGLLISEYDVNQNQLPRGGVIVSLASTPGLGFAPLVGASVTAVVGAGGSIVSVGLGTTDITGSGYFGAVGVAITETGHTGAAATITATVGAGGTLTFNVVGPGAGYTNPQIFVSEPSYSNLGVEGVSRLGIGATTDTGSNLLLNLEVGAANTVGIGSTLFEVKSFSIARPGYGFKKGDVFRPVGLVTDANLASPDADFELTVLETFNDSFSAWQFGELDYIDSISALQDGNRRRFSLYYNSELLSIETDPDDADSLNIDLDSILLIFINGVIQEPGVNYTFDGGSSFIFTTAPKPEDDISIFFYRGTRGTDSVFTEIRETIKIGDEIRLKRNNLILTTVDQESNRTVVGIPTSDSVETDIYTGLGIDEVNYKPFDWIKQKVDKRINNQDIYKTRDTLEPQIYPSAKIIGDFSTTDTEIFVDNGLLFEYEETESLATIQNIDLNALIIGSTTDPVAAAFSATVSVGGTISNIAITTGGSGYTPSSTITLSIAPPPNTNTGIAATATATVSVAGTVTSVAIGTGGLGYSTSIIPNVLAPTTNVSSELVTEFGSTNQIRNFVGVLTGISTSVGTGGHPLAITFDLARLDNIGDALNVAQGLEVGDPIYIYNTLVGFGVTSVNDSDAATVGIGTTYVDNIYIISAVSTPGVNVGLITCNVHSGINTTGINTSGIATSSPVGNFSVGKISGFTRSINPISIGVTGLTIDAGLSTFPFIQRRSERFGLRDTGALIGINTIL